MITRKGFLALTGAVVATCAAGIAKIFEGGKKTPESPIAKPPRGSMHEPELKFLVDNETVLSIKNDRVNWWVLPLPSRLKFSTKEQDQSST